MSSEFQADGRKSSDTIGTINIQVIVKLCDRHDVRTPDSTQQLEQVFMPVSIYGSHVTRCDSAIRGPFHPANNSRELPRPN